MDMTSVLPVSGADFTAQGMQSASVDELGTDGVSFAQMLGMVTGESSTATQLSDLNQTAGLGEGLSWREMQAMMGLSTGTGTGMGLENTTTDSETEIWMLLTGQTSGLNVDNLTPEKAKELMDLVEKLQKQLMEESTQNAQMMIAEQLMSLMDDSLTGESSAANFDTFAQMEAQSVGSQYLLSSSPEEILEMLTGIPQDMFTQMMQQAMQEEQALNLQPEILDTELDSTLESNVGESNQTTEVAQALADADEVTYVKGADVEAELEASKNIQEAKQGLEKAGSETKPENRLEKEELNIDRLQSQIDSGAHLQNTGFNTGVTAQVQKAENPELAQSVNTQVQTGIQEGLARGDEEFTIKLRPEGLGELTVKLARSEAGVMTLNLITKNAETQRLLESQVNLLQVSLQPMEVQVEAVMTEQQEMLMKHQQAFEQQQQQRQAFENLSNRESREDDEAEAEVVENVTASGTRNVVLDTYI